MISIRGLVIVESKKILRELVFLWNLKLWSCAESTRIFIEDSCTKDLESCTEKEVLSAGIINEST